MTTRAKNEANEALFSKFSPALLLCLSMAGACGGGGAPSNSSSEGGPGVVIDDPGTPPPPPPGGGGPGTTDGPDMPPPPGGGGPGSNGGNDTPPPPPGNGGPGSNNGTGSGDGSNNGNQQSGVGVLSLYPGEYWTYTWMTLDETYAQGSNPSVSSDYGSYTITVGASTMISGEQMYAISLSGQTPYSVPSWTHIGSAGDKILGSRDGVSVQTLFDFSGTPWNDGGWFFNWGANGEVDANLGQINNDFVDAPAWAAGTSTSSGGCQYYAEVDAMDGNGTGVICAGDDEWNIRKTEYAKEGVGMLGSSSRISYATNGGGFYSSHIKTVEVGLTDTSLTADDGWVPNAQVWSEGDEMQTPRMNFGTATWNGKLFVFGGSTSSSNAATSSVECYDPASDTWTNRAPLPNALYDCTAATLNGSIYVYGTRTGGSVFFGRYNPANNSWLPIAGAPEMSRAHAVTHTGVQMILFAIDAPGGSTAVSTVLYSPSNNEWMVFSAPLCSSNAPRQSTFGFAGNGEQMYLVGGFRYDMFDVWNPQDETTRARRLTGVGSCWEWIPELNVKRQGLACTMVGDDLFAIGGRNGSIKKTTVEVISTDGGTAWEELPGLMSPRCDHCAVNLDGKIYVLGGRDDDGLVTKSNFILDPSAL